MKNPDPKITIGKFEKQGYVVLPNLLDTSELYLYTLSNYYKGIADDFQVSEHAYSFRNDKVMKKLHKDLCPTIERYTGKQLYLTYNYYRTYRTGAILKMHRDRPACEISVTLNIGQKGKPWPIWILNYEEEPHKVPLKPGDALVYHGCDLYHWRSKLKGSDFVSQVFFHYVDKNGPNKWCKGDKIKIKPGSSKN